MIRIFGCDDVELFEGEVEFVDVGLGEFGVGCVVVGCICEEEVLYFVDCVCGGGGVVVYGVFLFLDILFYFCIVCLFVCGVGEWSGLVGEEVGVVVEFEYELGFGFVYYWVDCDVFEYDVVECCCILYGYVYEEVIYFGDVEYLQYFWDVGQCVEQGGDFGVGVVCQMYFDDCLQWVVEGGFVDVDLGVVDYVVFLEGLYVVGVCGFGEFQLMSQCFVCGFCVVCQDCEEFQVDFIELWFC